MVTKNKEKGVDVMDTIMNIKEEVYLAASRYGCPDEKLDRVWAIISRWEFPEDKEGFYSDIQHAISLATK